MVGRFISDKTEPSHWNWVISVWRRSSPNHCAQSAERSPTLPLKSSLKSGTYNRRISLVDRNIAIKII